MAVANALPHSLQSTVIFLRISLSILAAHRLQWAVWRTWPVGAKVRPHSLHVDGAAFFVPRGGGGGGLPPPLRALMAAALLRARLMACLTGSARYLRWCSRLRRRFASARHAFEQ